LTWSACTVLPPCRWCAARAARQCTCSRAVACGGDVERPLRQVACLVTCTDVDGFSAVTELRFVSRRLEVPLPLLEGRAASFQIAVVVATG
jgi:hypothetical protein